MTPSRLLIESIAGEYRRYKKLAEDAMGQVSDQDLSVPAPGGGNSIAVIVAHMAGNLKSRFTGFLTTDGEKPWRKRDEEFQPHQMTRAELLRKWDDGWRVLLEELDRLEDADLGREVTIRQQPLAVRDALMRSLAHAAYHSGQIVLLAKTLKGDGWRSLSIPLGQSERYNLAPSVEKPPAR